MTTIVIGDIRTQRGKLERTQTGDELLLERGLRLSAEAQVVALNNTINDLNDIVADLEAEIAAMTPVLKTLSSDFTTNADTMQAVTGMTVPVLANEVWKIEVFGAFQTAATTTGAGLSLSGPAGAALRARAALTQDAAGTDALFEAGLLAPGENFASAAVPSAATDLFCVLAGVVTVGATAGSIGLLFRSEVSGSDATLRAGTHMIATKIA